MLIYSYIDSIHEWKAKSVVYLCIIKMIIIMLANFTLTYALEALTTFIEIHSCIIIDTTVLSIGRRSPHNKSITARISIASNELGLSCKDNYKFVSIAILSMSYQLKWK